MISDYPVTDATSTTSGAWIPVGKTATSVVEGTFKVKADTVTAAPVYDITGPIRRTSPRIGRNSPCPCGSGRKVKKCCGKDTQ